MADQAELIRQQMEETRTSMTEKIEALEKQVSESVVETAETVAETVHTASETVDKTLETVSETIETVTETFNIPAHIANHPWMAVGGSVVLGYLIGSLIPSLRSYAPSAPQPPTPQPPAPQPVAQTETAEQTEQAEPQEERSNTMQGVIGSLKSLAIGTAVSMVSKTLLNSVPQDMRGGISGFIQDMADRFVGGNATRPSKARDNQDRETKLHTES